MHQSSVVGSKTTLFCWWREGCLFLLLRDNSSVAVARPSATEAAAAKQLSGDSPKPFPLLALCPLHKARRVLLSHSPSLPAPHLPAGTSSWADCWIQPQCRGCQSHVQRVMCPQERTFCQYRQRDCGSGTAATWECWDTLCSTQSAPGHAGL